MVFWTLGLWSFKYHNLGRFELGQMLLTAWKKRTQKMKVLFTTISRGFVTPVGILHLLEPKYPVTILKALTGPRLTYWHCSCWILLNILFPYLHTELHCFSRSKVLFLFCCVTTFLLGFFRPRVSDKKKLTLREIVIDAKST